MTKGSGINSFSPLARVDALGAYELDILRSLYNVQINNPALFFTVSGLRATRVLSLYEGLPLANHQRTPYTHRHQPSGALPQGDAKEQRGMETWIYDH